MVLHTLIRDLVLHGRTWGFEKIPRYKTKMAFVKFLVESTKTTKHPLFWWESPKKKRSSDATVDVYTETQPQNRLI